MSGSRARRTTIPHARPPATRRRPSPPRTPIRPHPPRRAPVPPRHVAHIVHDSDASLLDVVDHLLNKGVVLNADLVLGLADVDLIYVRLSALLCAADRMMPPDDV
jgi:hypothetical protein